MSVSAGAAYVIQPGDTISGVGRRFQTPVQNLIDLNGLGPRGAITVGQSIILPDSALDTGRDPYATGPAPVGVMVPENGVIPPPPPPPSGNPAAPAAAATARRDGDRRASLRPDRPPSSGRCGARSCAGSARSVWASATTASISAHRPARPSVRRRPADVSPMSETTCVGQGLTVLVVHRDGWRTVYGHLGSATVDDGADVRAGQQIGTVGLTAGDGRPSIHFETRRMQGDEPVAIDPLTVLPR